jgi:cyclopropane-fatty-acyl-phospholipid synthase
MSLHEASVAKLERICRKLELTPDDHVLEIGTGWGGFALHAASHYGCRVTTTTISREQFDYAKERVAAAGLEDRVTLLLQDYRDLEGQYDKLASIEMIEAVGHEYLDTYFAKCAELLKPQGMMLLQAITIADQRYQAALKSVDFIQRYIFPGGFLPSVTALLRSLTQTSDMRLYHLEEIGPHYARTLNVWRSNFLRQVRKIRAMGYSDSFLRMWNYYYCYCEGAFIERAIGTVQMLLVRPGCRREPIVPPIVPPAVPSLPDGRARAAVASPA